VPNITDNVVRSFRFKNLKQKKDFETKLGEIDPKANFNSFVKDVIDAVIAGKTIFNNHSEVKGSKISTMITEEHELIKKLIALMWKAKVDSDKYGIEIEESEVNEYIKELKAEGAI